MSIETRDNVPVGAYNEFLPIFPGCAMEHSENPRPESRFTGADDGPLASSFRGDSADLIKGMRNGTPANVVPALARRFGMSQDALFDVLRLPRSTLKARIVKNALLSAAEQDRLYRADRVWVRAMEVLEGESAVRAWLMLKNRSLGGEAPLALLDTQVGYDLVLDTLGRIEYGVVA